MGGKIDIGNGILDFTGGAELPGDVTEILNRTARELIEPFGAFIGKVSEDNAGNPDWWVSAPASRNVYASGLFERIVTVVTISDIFSSGVSISKIITDSAEMAGLFRGICGSAVEVEYRKPFLKNNKVLLFLKCLLTFLVCDIRGFVASFFARFDYSRIKGRSLTLIDSFILSDTYSERYYPGLWKELTEDEKENTFFVPECYGIKRFIRTFARLRSAEENYLLKEHFLRLKDYVYAFGYFFRAPDITCSPFSISGVEVSGLLDEEVRERSAFDSAVRGLLNFRFIEELKKAGADIRLFIDWFENQSLDKGLCLAMKKYYPGVKVKGYQGFINSELYLNLFPWDFELKAGALPDVVCVTGPALRKRVTKYCSGLPVEIAPSFRFNGVFDFERNGHGGNFTIFVVLPIFREDRDRMLMLLKGFAVSGLTEGFLLIIKAHPALKVFRNELENLFQGLNVEFELTEESFDDCVRKADVIFSGVSSACMEAVARGVPVIVLGNNTGITLNPFPENIEKGIYSIVFDRDSFERALSGFRGGRLNDYKKLAGGIRDGFFTRTNRRNVSRMLDL